MDLKSILKNSVIICKALKYKLELMKARTVGGFESPEPGNLSEKGKKLLAEVYAKYREQGMSKEEAAKRAWGAVRQAGLD